MNKTATGTDPKGTSPNCKAALLADVRVFRREVAQAYCDFFHEQVPPSKRVFTVFCWLLDWFDRDKQFAMELDEYLSRQRRRRRSPGERR
jgi:hypothetical protein